jgi:hypothetical protein
MACKKEEGRELLHSPALLLLAPIHRSAWNRNSPKVISKILHSFTSVPRKPPIQAPCIARPR